MKIPAYKFYCSKCGSIDIKEKIWIKKNSPNVMTFANSKLDYCPICDKYTKTNWTGKEIEFEVKNE